MCLYVSVRGEKKKYLSFFSFLLERREEIVNFDLELLDPETQRMFLLRQLLDHPDRERDRKQNRLKPSTLQ